MRGRFGEGTILLLMILGLLFVWFGDLLNVKRESAENAITETGIADGYRYFFALKNKLVKGSAAHWRRPILTASELKPFKTYFLLSPKRPLSEHESKVLLEWVKSGGRLILSFRDEKSLARMDQWLKDRSLPLPKTAPDKDFKNGVTHETTASGTLRFMKAGEKYVFYSYLRFADALCDKSPETCFMRETSVGLGEIVSVVGVPPFANGLLEEGDNARLATRFAYWTEEAAFDEFHQFLTEKSLGDMLLDPSLMLPLLGFLGMVLLYFFLGGGDLVERDLHQMPPLSALTTYHALGRELVRQAFSNDPGGEADARAWHAGALGRLLPREQKEIAEVVNRHQDASLTLRLIQFHQTWLKTRGKK